MGNMMQHDERACSADAVVAVARPWVAVQDATVQGMLGSRPSISTRTDAR